MEVVFLLGAGASAEAGVPLMDRFVPDLREELEPELRAVLDPLVRDIKTAAPEGLVDVEVVLQALSQLRNLSANLTAAALQQPIPAHLDPALLAELDRRVRAHVRRRCSEGITPDRLGYLRPLLDFRIPSNTLDIFSLNYDMCIEMLCEQAGIRYTDGFDLVWRDEALDEVGEEERPLIRLHKIHGSLVWYERSGYRFVKMPLLPTEGDLNYFDHEGVAQMMLYPAFVKEGSDRGPYPYLVHRFRRRLESARVLVVVGYGFRDQYVRALVTEAAMQNRRLSIVLVDPAAQELKWRHFKDLALAHRVVAHPSKTGQALREGALYRFIADLEEADSNRHGVERIRATNPIGAKQTLQAAARKYMALGHYDAVRVMVEEDDLLNPAKATMWQIHPLPRLDECLAFALAAGTAPAVWWRLVAPLLYWWERNLLMTSPEGDLSASVRPPQMPSINSENHDVDLLPSARSVSMLAAYEAAWPRERGRPITQIHQPRFRTFRQQVELLNRLNRLSRGQGGTADPRAERIEVSHAYLREESAGNLAWLLGQEGAPPAYGLMVDWTDLTLKQVG